MTQSGSHSFVKRSLPTPSTAGATRVKEVALAGACWRHSPAWMFEDTRSCG
jgi:hypothetical protein